MEMKLVVVEMCGCRKPYVFVVCCVSLGDTPSPAPTREGTLGDGFVSPRETPHSRGLSASQTVVLEYM